MEKYISALALLIFCLLLSTITVHAQQKTVSGTVTDAQTDSTLAGVNILVVGTSTGTATDADGHYELQVKSLQDTLRFSFIGYKTKRIPIHGQTTVDAALSPSVISGQQMVVVGYGTQKRSHLTGSVGSVGTESIEQSSPLNVQGALEGKIAGVQVVQTSGRPGGKPRVRIRGFTSITGSNNPLYVVDGVIVNNADLGNGTSPIDYMDPKNIESINVLKDASSTAIYGARGANGVVIITTKHPEGNQISYTGSVSMSQLPREIPVLSAEQFVKLRNIAWDNAEKYGLENSISDPRKLRANHPKLFNSQGQPIYNTNWQKAGTQTGISTDHHLTFGGGGENTNYGVSLGFNDQNGIMLESLSKSYTGRVYVNSEINSRITADGSINYSLTNQRQPKPVGGGGSNPPRQILETPPFLPVKFPNGQYANPIDYPEMDGGPQAVKLAYQRQTNLKTNNILGNANLNIHIVKGLDFKSTLGFNITDQKNKFFAAQGLQWVSVHGDASIADNNIKSWQQEDQLTYQTNFSGNQSFKALLAASWQQVTDFNFSTSVSDLNTLFYKYNNLGAASTKHTPASNKSAYSLNSYFARVNYSLNDKYNFTVTGRFDGSSKFSEANRYGFFPSGAFAWDISNENFLKDNSTISNLKMRLSYGITGNSQIPNYRTINQLGNYSYLFHDKLVSGVGLSTLANAELKWEKDKEADIGIDLGLFSGRLSFTGDIYYKKSSNILLDAPIPATSGYTSVIRNIGSMRNQGIELALKTINIRKPNFTWSTNFNISMNRNKVLHLVGGQDIINEGQTGRIIRKGEAVNSFWGYKILGTYGTDQKKEAAKYGYKPGDLIFADLNNDGEINANDETIIGNGLPKGQGSLINTFNYKNFHLLINLEYEYGNDVDWGTRYELFDRTGIANSFAGVMNAWTPDHQNTMVPQIRPDAGYIKPSANKSTWIYNGSFIRGKRVRLSYTFSQNEISNWGFTKLSVYMAADNLFLITAYPGFDPEVSSISGNFTQGIDMFAYPKPRTFQLGLSFSL
jgi:TonB-linked SusC/RagA family outer membrane protein